MQLNKDPNQLEVFSETKRRKTLVGTLLFDPKDKTWKFTYDKKYWRSKNAIAVGPELGLKKQTHRGDKGLFASFADRIPPRANPAYEEYCESQGISPKEKNPIILLTSIGRRGPSTFVFEPVWQEGQDIVERLKNFAGELNLSAWDIATAFDLFQLSVQRILNGKSKDKNILNLIEIFLTFPEVALWKLEKTNKKLPGGTAAKLSEYFSEKR
ncbi:MAG: HipA N-terminal domain-containing protein [Deltaproteobacteria bacterium]|nr:HipA N-terminal domain-containing protein [Deltaproteobacteria bacterium]